MSRCLCPKSEVQIRITVHKLQFTVETRFHYQCSNLGLIPIDYQSFLTNENLIFTWAVCTVSMKVFILVPLVIEVCGQVRAEADVVLRQEGHVEELGLEVVTVEIGIVGTFCQRWQLNIGFWDVAVETAVVMEGVFDKKSCAIAKNWSEMMEN